MDNRHSDYNYDRFQAHYYELEHFEGPKPGERFPDFKLGDISGNTINFDEFQNRWLCLETASVTCPQYISNIEAMQKLSKRHPDIVFMLLYVREAHPGNRIKPASTYDEKVALAKKAQSEYHEQRNILVDALKGDLHLRIGYRPNAVYLISPKGTVFFRSDWNVPEVLEEAINRREQVDFLQKDHYEPQLAHPLLAIKVVLRAGWVALYDIFKALPRIFAMHKTSKKIDKF